LLADLTRQAEMLDRYKREFIADTVTHGLDKTTTRKDSGIEWLGEIPARWELIKARWVFKQRNSKGNENDVLLSATQKFGMLPQDEIEGTVKVKETTDLQSFKTVRINDFVISLRSFQGGFEISDYEGVCSPAYQVFYNATPICHRYFKWLFKAIPFIDKMNSITTGIREGRNIPYKAFAQTLIPVPPIDEQLVIAEYLDKRLTLIDGLIADITAQIDQLKQYRQIVIHDAVTGKIKVTEG
jgi:type I restriction enzyme S subunit